MIILLIHFNGKPISGTTNAADTKDVEIAVPLRQLSSFGEFLKFQELITKLILFQLGLQIRLFLKQQVQKTFAKNDTKLYVPAVTYQFKTIQKLLQELISGFREIIYWNNYQSKVPTQTENQYFEYLIDLTFQRAN